MVQSLWGVVHKVIKTANLKIIEGLSLFNLDLQKCPEVGNGLPLQGWRLWLSNMLWDCPLGFVYSDSKSQSQAEAVWCCWRK